MMNRSPLASFDVSPILKDKVGICILGSTGSIGQSTLEVIRNNKERFFVRSLSAHSNQKLLKKQADEFNPATVALVQGPVAQNFTCKVIQGRDALIDLVQDAEVDIVVASIVGFAGLPPVLAALRAGKRVALANKESVVCGSHLIRQALEANSKASLIPVDSEHSALFQILQGENRASVRRLWLTASGGPFRLTPLEKFEDIRPEDALKHPNWDMGAKITIDSATMMNKALELIEACFLFGVSEKDVEIVVHPQSIIHSLVEFIDGGQLAQLSVPDMKGPIAYALGYPDARLKQVMPQLDLKSLVSLEFSPVDTSRFPADLLARECIRAGVSHCCAFNAANEAAVSAFLAGKITFRGIVKVVSSVIESWQNSGFPDLEELFLIDREARNRTEEEISANF